MRILFISILILSFSAQPCLAGAKAKKEVKDGNLLYNKGDFEGALKKYEGAFLDEPDSEVVNFDLGAALYKTGDHKAAAERFERSLVSQDPTLEQKAGYNLGNARYKYGIGKEKTDLKGAINLLEQSIRHYEQAIELDEEDADAKHNYEYVKKELKRLKVKQEQRQQKQEQGEDEEEQEQQKQEQGEDKKEQEKKEQQPSEEEQKGSGRDKEEEKEKPEEGREQEPEETKEEESGDTEEEPGSQGPPEQPLAEMTEEEAEMLLDSYRHEEEPKGLYKEKIPAGGLPETLKDW